MLAALGMAVATFTGGVAAYASGWLLFPAVLIFSYLSGLLATLGQRFQVVGLQWAIQLVIASAMPLPPAGRRGPRGARAGRRPVAGRAGRRVLGGHPREPGAHLARGRVPCARRYAEQNCRRTADGPVPPPAAFGSDAVHDPNPLLRAQERYRFLLLLEQAGRIRVSLAAAGELWLRLQRAGTGRDGPRRARRRAGGAARAPGTSGCAAGIAHGDRGAAGCPVAVGGRVAARRDTRRGTDPAAP